MTGTNQNGLTILETVLVLALLGVMAVMTAGMASMTRANENKNGVEMSVQREVRRALQMVTRDILTASGVPQDGAPVAGEGRLALTMPGNGGSVTVTYTLLENGDLRRSVKEGGVTTEEKRVARNLQSFRSWYEADYGMVYFTIGATGDTVKPFSVESGVALRNFPRAVE